MILNNNSTVRNLRVLPALLCALFGEARVVASDFSVTTPGGAFAYTINGAGSNPTLTLIRGATYTFAVNSDSFHPFQVLSGGAVNNNTSSGTVTYTVPNVASNYIYWCSIHHFGGTIVTVAPPAPPAIKILSLLVNSNLTLRSTGTNTWSVIPEYKTNLSTTNWFALTVQTNRFLTGTNETICGKPPGSPILIRIRSQPQ